MALITQSDSASLISPSRGVFAAATLAELKTFTVPLVNQTVEVDGSVSRGDGLAGTYYWNATDSRADNGTTIIASNAGGVGRWNLVAATALDSTFTPAGAGAVAESVQTTLRRIVFGEQYGVTGDGLTDDAVALQKAVTAAYGKILKLSGTILIGSQINVTSGIEIVGDGMDVTSIKLNSATMVGLNVTCASGFSMRDIKVTTGLVASAGAGIKIDGTGGGRNTRARFFNVECSFMWQGIVFVAGEGWIVDSCGFFGTVDAGIVIQNTVSPDSGDNWIVNSYFSGGVAASDSIRHNSSGGLTVAGCKFQVSGTAYHMLWNSTTGSSQISLIGNHVEPQLTGSFIFERTVASGGISGINIKYNYFNNSTAIPAVWFKTNSSTTTTQVSLGGNTYQVGSSGTGIQIDGGTLYSITGEQFQGNAGTSVGVATGNATATAIFLGSDNQFYSIGTNYSINTVSQIQKWTGSFTTAQADNYNTELLSVSALNATATTIKTFAANPGALGVYVFEADVAQGSDVTAAWAMIAVGNTTITIMTSFAGTMTITVSGLNLRVTQTTGSTQTVTGRLFKFGP